MVIPIHVTQSIESLNKMTELGANITKHSCKVLAEKTSMVLREAEKFERLGDEENAYIFYMKYFNLISIIQNSRDFAKIKTQSREYFGTKDQIMKRMDKLERLKDSLMKRYKQNLEKTKQNIVEENKENSQIAANVNKNVGTNSQFIGCIELYNLMSKSPSKLLLIDCRSSFDFNSSRILYANQINIPDETITIGLSASKMSAGIAGESRILWANRGAMDWVVLVDEDTSEKQLKDSSKTIWILRESLNLYDPDVRYTSLLVLDGGFMNFLISYPMRTTNPKFQPKLKAPQQLYPKLEDIEYEFPDEIKMKPKQPDANQKPRFDRSSKPSFGQKPLAPNKPNNILAYAIEQENIYDDLLKKENEALSVGKEYISTLKTTITPSESDPTEHFNKQTELEYKLIQKENELNDTIMTVEPDLESLDEVSIGDQNPQTSEVLARIREKKKIHAQNKKAIEQVAQKREELGPAAKEQLKRHLQMKEEEEDLVRPKLPAFDRSSKPAIDRGVVFPQIQRDFSPVYGSYGEPGATGLKNLGNTCYMNSIIQCLLNLEPFCEYLKEGAYMKHVNRKSKTQGQVCEELAQLRKELWSGNYKSISPRDFRAVIGREHKMFATYDQQDAHELLVILIDILHSELKFPMDGGILNETAPKSEVAWREFLKNTQSIIQSLFFGQIRSTVKCRTCRFESATYEGFSHLSLELPQNNRPCQLTECFDLYFNGEVIEGWTCPQCKQNREAIKKLDISKLPPVLVIHLKRFHVSLDASNTYIKKQNYVQFPIEKFEIMDYITPSLKQRKGPKSYELYAVSNHYGTMNRGHYTAFCKNYKSNSWYKYDDNYVTRISINDVNSSAGYILFYSQI